MDQGDDDDGQMADAEFSIRVAFGIGAFTCDEWDGFAGTTRGDKENGYNPLVSFAFLSALEESGCAVRRTGWQGHHLRLETAQGRLLGAVPCYLKSHSQGEYVFDHGWSDAFERAGGRYYPKLQSAVPFTPVTGPRLLVSKGEDDGAVKAGLAAGLKMVTDRLGVSSAHVTFAPESDVATLEAAGFLHRTDQQFHFFNEGFSNYDDFLATLASRKRKAMKKERREALVDGITIDWLTGKDLTEKAWDDFFAFYMDTGSRKWGRPYLNRQFFSLIGERMADDILLVMARRNGRYIAGAINFIGSDALYGRNWGCIEDHPFLHFEVCYHQAIDFAIERGLKVVEAGAQGEHKLARGYRPVTMHSAHYIAHPGLRNAVADYLRRERREVERMGEYLEEHTPFRKDLAE
ncbi:GNAT family N-acetyltransferase [Mesorhizobium sp. M4B.F.Ca.ET.143.01.1.1]|uniref:GNAT family N-acetyltransferase n=1 Tax=Mesorhizobium sp. M4B.F.Ca.ET.143.01.1.1 TaxID=2563947 RepID=UPI001093D448|nr:GNAT family N-acetyltransferase [Mesorhizobium sp. M4B.F.Ca.ET.143.01.1.1]TGV22238.1 GNAT family N-acetyltransferase [Mesorhizobium sp. M4B.F.Ca.ET.143.01.1.1]